MKKLAPLALALSFAFCLALPSPARSQTPLDTVLFANGFFTPVYVCAPAGDKDRLFVVQQGGLIRIRKGGVTLATPFLNVTALILSGGERGLLGMAFHPNYAVNGFFYVYYTSTPSGNLTVARYQVSANPDVANAASATILLSVPHPSFSNHNAGALNFGPDGFLYFGTGDGGSANDPSNNAQNVNSRLGKMLRIDVDNPAGGLPYGIPANNPLAGATAGFDEIWAIGLRNPYRFSFDRDTGDMWIGDVGQNAREEIDFQAAADFFAAPGSFPVKNYGWRCMEGLLCTGLTGCTCFAGALTSPVYNYVNPTVGTAVIGGYVYRGCAVPDLRGTYFFSDYNAGQIWSFRLVGGVVTNFLNRTAELDPAGALSISTISSFGEDGCGELYICDHLGGEIFKVVPSVPQTTGLLAYGTGSPGCFGAHTLGANCPAVVNSPCWTLTCDNAPPSSLGILGIADVQDLAGSDPLGGGPTLHVSLASPFLAFLPMLSDALGAGTFALPVPNFPAIVGLNLFAQVVWPWPVGPCAPPTLGASSSNGLSITIQG